MKLKFVNVSNPTERITSESRSQAHSHAIRQAHAKKRHQQTQKYQDEVLRAQVGEKPTAALDLDQDRSLVVLNPRAELPARDPLSNFARSLPSHEYFLLDRCK